MRRSMEERLYCVTCDSTSAMTSWTSETRALCAAALALTRALRDATMSSLRATACGSREDVVSLLAALSTNRERGRGGANARARAISCRSDARVDVVVARDATRANAGSDGRRGTMKGVTRGCHDSVNVSGRTSGEAPWRAGKLLAIRRAATGGAARGLPAWTGTLMTMEGAVATDMADARAWGSGARPGVSWTFRREAVRNDEAARVSCVI